MENENKVKEKTDIEVYIQIVVVAVLALIIAFSAGKIFSVKDSSVDSVGLTGATVLTSDILPTGVPAVYGEELQVRYDDVSPSNPKIADATIQKLSVYAQEGGPQEITLTGEALDRYIKIGSSIACEYCCGAKSLIFSDGSAACGCAHSYSMRGLAKYLLQNHPEMTDEEILSELGKWKVLFFPDVHIQKAQVLEANGIDSKNYINLASNLYRGAEKGASAGSGGSMVGGC